MINADYYLGYTNGVIERRRVGATRIRLHDSDNAIRDLSIDPSDPTQKYLYYLNSFQAVSCVLLED